MSQALLTREPADQGVFERTCSQASILSFTDTVSDDLPVPAVYDSDSVTPMSMPV